MEHLDPRIVRTREAVLDAATALLVEGGPDAVTMDGVVQRSRVAKSTIYRHWSGRDELLTEVFDHNAPHIDTPPVELGFREALEYVMAQVVDALNDPRWSELMPALMLLKMHEAGPARLEAELKDEQAQALTEALRRGVAEGIVAEDCAPTGDGPADRPTRVRQDQRTRATRHGPRQARCHRLPRGLRHPARRGVTEHP